MFTTVATYTYAGIILVLVAWVIRERRRARRLRRIRTVTALRYYS
jgi:hypothetical protein